MIKKYVVGFAYSLDKSKVLLIKKETPLWQKGTLNGIGGKIEEKESPLDAMSRECEEEAGIYLEWREKGVMKGENNNGEKFVCHIFYAYSDEILNSRQKTAESLIIINPLEITQYKTLANLKFLIPYGLSEDNSKYLSIEY